MLWKIINGINLKRLVVEALIAMELGNVQTNQRVVLPGEIMMTPEQLEVHVKLSDLLMHSKW